MNFELIFSGVGILAMAGWILLLLSPWLPTWSDRIAGLAIPLILAVTYVTVSLLYPAQSGGFETFARVTELFSYPQALLAGWVHFLTFDLFIGAWICRTARQEQIRFWFVLPCLPVTFLLGPAGFLLFSTIRAFHPARKKQEMDQMQTA